jgi:hypothetical protein
VPAGRPSSFNREIADEILERLSNGEPLTKICRDDHMPAVSTVFRWEKTVEGFSEEVTRARECSADHFSHEIIEISDENPICTTEGENFTRTGTDPAGIQRNKVRIDTRIKLMQMLKRKTYGDKLDLNVSGELSIADRVKRARERSAS